MPLSIMISWNSGILLIIELIKFSSVVVILRLFKILLYDKNGSLLKLSTSEIILSTKLIFEFKLFTWELILLSFFFSNSIFSKKKFFNCFDEELLCI